MILALKAVMGDKFIMIVLINYADLRFRKAQKLNTWSGKHIAKVDKVFEYTDCNIDDGFRQRNNHIFSVPTGGGLWLWKPYIVYDALKKMQDGDILIYCDSGAFFCRNVRKKFVNMEEDIWVSDIPFVEKQFSKADAFVIMECTERCYWESNQIQGTIFAIRKKRETLDFAAEWLAYCENEYIMSLAPNKMGVENDPSFIDNRWDQTVLSLLCKKRNIVPHRDPSQYGKVPEAYLRMERVIFAPPVHKEKAAPFLILHRTPDNKLTIIAKQYLLAILPRRVSLFILKLLRKPELIEAM